MFLYQCPRCGRVNKENASVCPRCNETLFRSDEEWEETLQSGPVTDEPDVLGPADPPVTKPAVKPTTPVTKLATKPVTPVTKPATPVTKPVAKPAAKPTVPVKPVVRQTPVAKPVVRQAPVAKPVTRATQPVPPVVRQTQTTVTRVSNGGVSVTGGNVRVVNNVSVGGNARGVSVTGGSASVTSSVSVSSGSVNGLDYSVRKSGGEITVTINGRVVYQGYGSTQLTVNGMAISITPNGMQIRGGGCMVSVGF